MPSRLTAMIVPGACRARCRCRSTRGARRPDSSRADTSSGTAARIFTGRPCHPARAPGAGDSARMRRSSTAASLRPVDQRIGAPDLGRVGDARGRLRRATAAARRARGARARRRSCRRRVSPACRAACRPYRRASIAIARAAIIGSGVETGVHLHDRDAGRRVAGLDRARDRRGAAPARQQRGMDVETAVARPGEDRGRQHQAIRGNDEHVECRFGERRLDRFGAEARQRPGRPARARRRSA